MDDSDIEQEKRRLRPAADSFRDLLTGDIDIIEYLNSGPGSVRGASSESIFEEEARLISSKMDINALLMGNAPNGNVSHLQHGPQQNVPGTLLPQPPPHHMSMPMLHATANGLNRPGGAHPAPVYGQQQQNGYHRTSQERPPYEQYHPVKLPDSPPETDSGAGSAGSPSSSETGPYSPEFQQFQRQQLQHQAALAAASSAGILHPPQGVIHPPVIGGGNNGMPLPGTSGQIQPPPGVILNVHNLDHLTQAVVSEYLPLNGRANNHINGQLTPGAVDYFAVAAVAAGQGGANASVQPPPTPGGTQQTSPNGPASGASYTPYILPALHSSPYAGDGQLPRKRARADSITTQFVKPEPGSPPMHASEESLFCEDSLAGHQAIRFSEFQKEQWHALCNGNGREMQSLAFAVVADKGFNYSQFDTSFVNQKKNHFQISVHIEVRDQLPPKFVKVPGDGGGLKPISQFQLDFYGVKAEMPSSMVQIKQSQTDRKPIPYEAVTLELPASRVTKVTVARLHFSETTMNNQRKNGRPNPDQKYFYLVASLNAVVQGNEKYTIVAYNSERVIVRASNPGQFDSGDSEVHWQKGQTTNSIYHPGPVGIGTDKPTSALAVTGDISYTGTVYHPSDAKLKQNIQEVNCAEALSKLSQLRVVQYEIIPEIAEKWGLKEEERQRVGVIAQEVETVIPEAVKENGDYLTVDDNRIFYESAAAVKELCRLTGNLEYKVEEVEKISKKLSKLSHLRRLGSLRSVCSNSTCDSKPSCLDSSVSDSNLSVGPPLYRKDKSKHDEKGSCDNDCQHRRHRHHGHHYHHHVCRRFSFADRGNCDNRVIQMTIVILVAIMAFCLMAMATLYILDWHKRNSAPAVGYWIRGGDSFATAVPGRWPTNASYSSVTRLAPGEIVKPNTPKGLTPSPTTPKHASVLPPDIHPCVNLPCAEFCCPNSNSYYAFVVNGESIETDDRSHNSSSFHDSEGKLKDNPTIVLIARTAAESPSIGTGFREKLAEAMPKFFSSNGAATAHFPYISTRRDEGGDGERSSIPKLTLLGVNTTIDGQYCLDDSCRDPKRGNFTYYIPISKYMPHIPLEVKFAKAEKQTLQYCTKSTGAYCIGLEERSYLEGNKRNPRAALMDLETDIYQRQEDTWELPVGIYQSSSFRFRVGYSTALCDLENDEAGVTFVEYNLNFYRTCN